MTAHFPGLVQASSNNKTLNARLLARVITDAITRNGAAAEIFCARLTELLTPAFINNKT